MSTTDSDASPTVVLSKAVAPADIPDLCEGMRRVLGADRQALVICDVGAIDRPDAVTVDAIAQLQLTAKRMGCLLLLKDVRPRLRELIELSGLSEALPSSRT